MKSCRKLFCTLPKKTPNSPWPKAVEGFRRCSANISASCWQPSSTVARANPSPTSHRQHTSPLEPKLLPSACSGYQAVLLCSPFRYLISEHFRIKPPGPPPPPTPSYGQGGPTWCVMGLIQTSTYCSAFPWRPTDCARSRELPSRPGSRSCTSSPGNQRTVSFEPWQPTQG